MTDRLRIFAPQTDLARYAIAAVPTGATALLQLAIFALTARALGPDAFGLLIVIYAAAAISVELSGLGGDEIIVRRVSTDVTRTTIIIGHALVLFAIAAPVVIGVCIATAGWLVPQIPMDVIAMIVVGDVVFQRAMALYEKTFIAHGQPIQASVLRMAGLATRALAAVITFALLGVTDIAPWATAIVLQSLAVAVIIGGIIVARYGWPIFKIQRAEVPFGLFLMVNQVARNLQSNLDRILLAPVLAAGALGLYGASTRLLMIGTTLNQVASRIFYPRFFVAAADSPVALRTLTYKAGKAMVAGGVLSAILIAIAAQILPLVLGPGFEDVRILSIIIGLCCPFVALQYPPADALTATDHQVARTVIYLIGAVVFSAGLVLGVLTGGLYGAAVMYVIGHAVLAAALWIAAARLALGTAQKGA